MKISLACMLIGLMASTGVSASTAKYEAQRAVYGEMSQLRGQNAIAVAGESPVRAKHSKAWIAVREKALKMFGEDHACYKAAFFSQTSWTSMTSASAHQAVSAASSMAFQAGEWSAYCSLEIDKARGQGIASK